MVLYGHATTRCRGWGERVIVWLQTVLMTLLMAFVAPDVVVAEQARAAVQRIDPLIHQDQLSMDIDIDMALSDSMKEALERGVALSFTIEVKIEEPRWWWFNKTLVDAQLTRRIAFNTLTRQWRVGIGDLGFVVGSYEEALDIVRRVRGWEVAPLDRFEFNTPYLGQVRIMLDTTQLSRPMQLDANKRSDWNLVSPWRSFEFSVDRNIVREP
jgi:hypothetical protein